MPKKLEDIRKALERDGMEKSRAYAIATATYQKMKAKKKKNNPHPKSIEDLRKLAIAGDTTASGYSGS